MLKNALMIAEGGGRCRRYVDGEGDSILHGNEMWRGQGSSEAEERWNREWEEVVSIQVDTGW